MDGLAAFADGSQALTITGAGIEDSTHPYPLDINLQALSSIPSGTYTSNGTDEILIHGDSPRASLDVDATMHDRGVPYHLGGGGSNTVLDVGALIAQGTMTQPITFTSASTTPAAGISFLDDVTFTDIARLP